MSRRRSTIGCNTSSAKRVRLIRSNKNDLERGVLLLLYHERYVSQRVRESSVDRTVRLSLDRESHINRWSNKEYSAIKYNTTIDYRNNPAIFLGSPTIVCQYC